MQKLITSNCCSFFVPIPRYCEKTFLIIVFFSTMENFLSSKRSISNVYRWEESVAWKLLFQWLTRKKFFPLLTAILLILHFKLNCIFIKLLLNVILNFTEINFNAYIIFFLFVQLIKFSHIHPGHGNIFYNY